MTYISADLERATVSWLSPLTFVSHESTDKDRIKPAKTRAKYLLIQGKKKKILQKDAI